MTLPTRKKLIEVSIPLEAINVASAREKSIRHGHPSTLHLWWARRPLAACRAVLFSQLVDDPSSWPDRFQTSEEQELERRRLHRLIERLVPWKSSTDDAILNEARWEIARSVAWGSGVEPPPKDDSAAILDYLRIHAPIICDPFSGGGSIPLEAQRLGLRAYGSDLNPVAVLIGKALVEVPPKFAGHPPINPGMQAELERGALWNGRAAQGLAEDVRYYGLWMREQAELRIGDLYPKATLANGNEATVIAWVWARTVPSPDPAAKGAMVPLISNYMLSTSDARKAWMIPVRDASEPDGWRIEVRTGDLAESDEERLRMGTKSGKGEFTCLLTGTPISEEYLRRQTSAGNGAWRTIAVIAEAAKGKQYLNVSAAPIPSTAGRFADEAPNQPMFRGALGFRVPAYGVCRWGDFFRDRQCAALSTFADLLCDVQAKVAFDAAKVLPEAEEYGRSVAAMLTCALGRAVDYWTINTMWEAGGEFVIHTFSEMTIPIVWDAVEANPFANGGGGWNKTCLDWVVRVIDVLPALDNGCKITQLRAQDIEPPLGAVFSTDPPYFDNIGYADLSDAFYVWERKALGTIDPSLGRRLSTPKEDELVATAARHGGAKGARDFFLSGMTTVFKKMEQSASTDPITIYYSYKEKGRVGQGTGWESFLEAIVRSGWQVDASWPLRTERPTRNRSIGKSALASSIVLVCRKRPAHAEVVTRAEFIRELKRELPDAIEKIRKAGVGPVDMQQSVIGPAMGVFSRFARVLEDDDTAMAVKAALATINRVWEEIENELDAAFDAETQVALAWFGSFGFDPRPPGELITLTTAKNTSDRALFESGVFKDMKGKVALTSRADLPVNWNPLTDKTLTVWECVQHTAHALNAVDGGSASAARLVAQMGAKSADALALAYRLFEISAKKGWSSEALVYNALAQEWPRLEDIATGIDARIGEGSSGQGSFTFEDRG